MHTDLRRQSLSEIQRELSPGLLFFLAAQAIVDMMSYSALAPCSAAAAGS